MPTPPTTAGDIPPVALALTQASVALNDVITIAEDDGLAVLDDESFATFVQDLEKFRNRIGLVDHQVVNDADNRDLGRRWMRRNTTGLMRHLLHISPGEAHGRRQAAEAISPRKSMQGEALPPKRPVLAAAFRAGTLNPNQLNTAIRTLETLDKAGIDPAESSKAEATLADLGSQFEPKDFNQSAEKIKDVLLPDGTLDDERHHRIRNFYLKENSDGSFTPGGRLTPTLGAKMRAALDPFAKPQPAEDGTPDARDAGQRLHDALEMGIDRLVRTGTLPISGGTPATVIVTIKLEDLLARTGHGETSDGTLICTDEVLRIANEAEIIPAIFRRHGLPLDLGRSRRIANQNQNLCVDRPRSRLLIPRLHHPSGLVRTAPHSFLA